MRFTFKKTKRQTDDKGQGHATVARHFSKGYSFVQSKWARWMDGRMQQLSQKAQFLIWAAFALCAGSYSSYLIYKNLFTGSVEHHVEILTKPLSRFKSRKQHMYKSGHGPATLPQGIVHYRQVIDSLARSPTGRKIYERIIKEHPGLLDSLQAVEKQYKLK